MPLLTAIAPGMLLIVALTSVSACSSDTPNGPGVDDSTPGLDPELFLEDALVAPASTESCNLSGGAQTMCYRLVIAGAPTSQPIGPFCPRTIHASADEGGIWFDGSGELYEVDGNFIVNLSTIYGDANWQLYDPNTDSVRVTDTKIACEAAARPNVAPQYRNHCVECSIGYYGGGVTQTLLIPTRPVPAPSPIPIRNTNVGVALNGVALGPPAPVAAILGAYTIAAFDDCGGHVNPHEGYHYHAATKCNAVLAQDDGHASMMGYAMDGYAIFGTLDADGSEPEDLDSCRGHRDETRGYHYHAASTAENRILGCLSGQAGSIAPGAGHSPRRRPHP